MTDTRQFEVRYRPFRTPDEVVTGGATAHQYAGTALWYATAQGAGCSKNFERPVDAVRALIEADLGAVVRVRDLTPIIWTEAMRAACRAVAADPAEVEYRNMADVRSRAAEFVRHQRVGEAMTPMNVEYFASLYQRLETSERYGLDSHRALAAAWNA
jgi:hypothetical protein